MILDTIQLDELIMIYIAFNWPINFFYRLHLRRVITRSRWSSLVGWMKEFWPLSIHISIYNFNFQLYVESSILITCILLQILGAFGDCIGERALVVGSIPVFVFLWWLWRLKLEASNSCSLYSNCITWKMISCYLN